MCVVMITTFPSFVSASDQVNLLCYYFYPMLGQEDFAEKAEKEVKMEGGNRSTF